MREKGCHKKKRAEDDGKLHENYLNKQWLPLFKGFQWRPVLAKYCLKVRLMDDYLMGKLFGFNCHVFQNIFFLQNCSKRLYILSIDKIRYCKFGKMWQLPTF